MTNGSSTEQVRYTTGGGWGEGEGLVGSGGKVSREVGGRGGVRLQAVIDTL